MEYLVCISSPLPSICACLNCSFNVQLKFMESHYFLWTAIRAAFFTLICIITLYIFCIYLLSIYHLSIHLSLHPSTQFPLVDHKSSQGGQVAITFGL